MKDLLKIFVIVFLCFSCSLTKKRTLYNQNHQCIENEKFRNEYFKNIEIIDSLINKNQNESFHKSLRFISLYTHVSFETMLNYGRLYPYGAFEKDKKIWLDWYEENRCSNIQFKK